MPHETCLGDCPTLVPTDVSNIREDGEKQASCKVCKVPCPLSPPSMIQKGTHRVEIPGATEPPADRQGASPPW